MKTFKKSVPILLFTLLLTLLLALAACTGEQTYTLTLDANGGTVSTSTLKLKEGENVYNAVREIIPTKGDLIFGAWFEGDSELSASRTMPAEGLTLTARYKAGYTVEVYLQSGASYVYSENFTFSGAAYVGAEFTVTAPGVAGYIFNAAHANNVSTLVISESASENIFKLFYVAESAGKITYHANAPEGMTATGSTAETLPNADGTAVVAAGGFKVEGYRFAGWSTSPRGTVNYAAGQTVTLDGTLNLYAVWDKGYPDRFGGNDMVYLPQSEPGVAILGRGTAELRGTAEDNELTFTLPGGDVLRGRLFRDTLTFALAHEDLADTYVSRSAYYNPETGEYPLNRKDTLTIDEFGTAFHTYVAENGSQVTDNGIIIENPQTGEYLFLIMEGEGAGGGFVFCTGVDVNANGTKVFLSTFGEGGIYYELLTGDGFSGFYGDGTVYLDGYGTIYFYDNIFHGVYWIEEVYSNGSAYYIYRIRAILQDVNNQARDVLGYDVVDGFFGLDFYTIPLSETDYAYVSPKAEAGEYSSSGEGTLVLDGYRMFPNSAVYTDANGNETIGSYDVTATPRGELLIRLTDMYTGSVLSFRLAAGEGGEIVFTRESATRTEVEYILLEDGAFSYRTVLAIYADEDMGSGNTQRASLLVEMTSGKSDYIEGATGYVTAQTLKGGNAILYTFTRTGLNGGFVLPKEFTFMLSAAFDNSYFSRELYYVFSYTYDDGTVDVRYRTVRDANGSGAEIWYMNVGVTSLGSILFDGYGEAYAGGFIVDTTSYYFGSVGTFVWINARTGSVEYFYYALDLDGNGNPVLFEEIIELEYPVYGIAQDGTVDGSVHLIMRGREVLYSASGFTDESDIQRLTVVRSGATSLGDPIVNLVNDEGITVMSLITEKITYNDYGTYVDIWVYYGYRAAADGDFSAGNASLTLDGYRSARYMPAGGGLLSGTFTLSSDNKVVTFTTRNGEVYLFGLEGPSFRVLDGVYGSYFLHYLGEWYTLTFDGQGNVTARIGNILMGGGLYSVLDAERSEMRLFVDLGGGIIETLTVARGYDGLVVLDEKTQGVFVGSDFSVLDLDGYGGGTYYAADGSAGVAVYYDIVSAEDGFVSIVDDNFNYYTFILDGTHHSFSRPVTLGEERRYYASDFTAFGLSWSGEVVVNNEGGYYSILGEKMRLYLANSAGEYEVIDLDGIPAGEPVTVKGKTYYPWTRGKAVTFTGTVELTEGGVQFSENAKLTFTPNGDVQFYIDGTFEVGGKTYAVTVVNQYWDYRSNAYRGMALYDGTIYEYSPFTQYSYDPYGESTFSVTGGLVETTMYDGFEEKTESYITEYYVGFGPIRLSDTTVSGAVVTNDVTLRFENAPVVAVLCDSADMGNRYMAVFTVDDTQYAVFYYKFDGDYWLYMIATYDIVETDGYAVGVARYYSSNDGFTFPTSVRRGTPFSVVLYDGAKDVIMAYNTYFNGDGTSAWLIALGSYDPAEGTGELGSIYSIVFTDETLAFVTVTKYAVRQATGSVGSVFYFANLFMDEAGNIASPASIAVNTGTGYEFLSFNGVERVTENVWVFHGTDGYDYTMTVLTDEDGNYLTDDSGEYLQITLTSQVR